MCVLLYVCARLHVFSSGTITEAAMCAWQFLTQWWEMFWIFQSGCTSVRLYYLLHKHMDIHGWVKPQESSSTSISSSNVFQRFASPLYIWELSVPSLSLPAASYLFDKNLEEIDCYCNCYCNCYCRHSNPSSVPCILLTSLKKIHFGGSLSVRVTLLIV